MGDQPVSTFPLSIRLTRSFTTAGGVVNTRDVVLVRVGPEPYGWGEAAPFPGQDESVHDVVEAASAGEWTPTLLAAVDEATADREARVRGVSLFDTIGATTDRVPVSLAVGLDDPIGTVERSVGQGILRFKLKISPGHVAHVGAIRSRFPDLVLGVDANGSFDAGTVAELDVLRDLDILYCEQPTVDLASEAVSRLRSTTNVPVFADESVRAPADAETMLALDSVDGVVVKPGRLGWTGALAVRDMANAAGKFWRASGLLETGIGRAYTDILAGCPDVFLSDVAPAELFLTRDVTASRFVDGHISVPTDPGLGVVPDPDAVGISEQEGRDLG